jgi:sporulation protein YlmC with PRC-barrel domain
VDANLEHDTLTFSNHEVIDQHGTVIGKVTDVISDSRTLEPQWMVVDLGHFKASHYVPTAGAYQTDDGPIITPYSPSVVKDSMKAPKDHVLTAQAERDLMQHYGIGN